MSAGEGGDACLSPMPGDRLVTNGSVAGKPTKLCTPCGLPLTRTTPRGKPLTMQINAVLG
jgi:hypothetical protein